MAGRRSESWEDDYEAYSPNQIDGLLEFCGIRVDSDTSTHFIGFCPFHGNENTAAFAINKTTGMWNCFNQSCSQSGSLLDLVRRLKKYTHFQAQRAIIKHRKMDRVPFDQRIKEIVEAKQFPAMSDAKIDELHSALWDSPGLEYMRSRGFDDNTLEHFKVGYSPARVYPAPYKSRPEMVTVPMHDIDGNGIGVVGRSIEGKEFKNSKGLPKSQTAWNIHRAKLHGPTVIVLEASFDGMSVHQAGYPNVIGLLGGDASSSIIEQINRHFSTVIHMEDFDDKQFYPNCRRCRGMCSGHRPGRDLARKIIQELPNKKHLWAAYDDTCVFPRGVKDANSMTGDEIRQCIKNSVSNLEYVSWGIEQ